MTFRLQEQENRYKRKTLIKASAIPGSAIVAPGRWRASEAAVARHTGRWSLEGAYLSSKPDYFDFLGGQTAEYDTRKHLTIIVCVEIYTCMQAKCE